MKTITLCMIVGSFLLLAGCSGQSAQQDQPRAQDPRTEASSELATRFNAVTWEDRFGGASATDNFYTFTVQKALLETNDRPITFQGHLQDMSRRGQAFSCRFETSVLVSPDVVFDLQCDPDQVQRITDLQVKAQSDDDSFVVVAKVTDVMRPGVSLNGENVALQVPDTFLATGQLLDFLYIPTSQSSK